MSPQWAEFSNKPDCVSHTVESARRSVFDDLGKGCLVGVRWVGWLGGLVSVSGSGSKFGCRGRLVPLLPLRRKKASSGEWPQQTHGAGEHAGTAVLENAGVLCLGD